MSAVTTVDSARGALELLGLVDSFGPVNLNVSELADPFYILILLLFRFTSFFDESFLGFLFIIRSRFTWLSRIIACPEWLATNSSRKLRWISAQNYTWELLAEIWGFLSWIFVFNPLSTNVISLGNIIFEQHTSGCDVVRKHPESNSQVNILKKTRPSFKPFFGPYSLYILMEMNESIVPTTPWLCMH